MKRFSSLALTATIIGILLSMSINAGLEPIAYSIVYNNNWQLTVTGRVDKPLTLTIADLIAMPKTSIFAQIFCVGPPGFFVEEGNWTGVKLSFLLEKAELNANAVKIAFFASDGFSTDLAIQSAMNDEVIVAYEKDGEALDETLRLVVPGRWGYKWIYNLNRIEVVDYNFLGRYESQGYSDSALTTEAGAPNTVGSSLPGQTRNDSSPIPSASALPQSSPTPQSPSPPVNQDHSPTIPPEAGTPGGSVVYTIIIAAVIILITALTLYYVKFKKLHTKTTYNALIV